MACPGCRRLIFGRRLQRHLDVCPECHHHRRLSADARLAQLLDPGSQLALPPIRSVTDPLGFVDEQPYAQRLAAARAATGLSEGVAGAHGTIEGQPVVVAAMDFGFIGGSLGAAEGERITAAAEYAGAHRLPLVVVTASGGARMQEGALSLMQMAKTSQAFAELDEAGILTVAVISDPTYGGVAASFATLADIIIAESGARLGFAGPRVIEQTLRTRLPEGFQTAQRLHAQGLLDEVRPRGSLRSALGQLLRAAVPAAAAPESPGHSTPLMLVREASELPAIDPWRVVQLARERARPTTLAYASQLLDGFYELHGDRLTGDCPAIVGGLGRLGGAPVMLIGHQKGQTTRELVDRNFGMASPAGYRKSARLLRLAAKLGVPVVTLIDTPGAAADVAAEDQGQAFAIAENLRLLAGLPVPVVAVVTGEGGSGGALALAVADRVYALANSTYSVISPEGCAAILWRGPAAAPQAAAQLRLTAPDLLRMEIIDGVVPEPDGGAHSDPVAMVELLREVLNHALRELTGVPPAALVRRRRARFREFGQTLPSAMWTGSEEVSDDDAAAL
ncbi:acetyl-CoA carboxylase carboxyl transferase subunit alpha [Natronosporangium hydrolyticum]|uniref:Multifunctional fusion protein n=1 Tax=Natronosporangium hydrolyticum TaxID=2811111 RepID=A0A895YPH0_9ACTN|nr:acetyl-CoA carboxylase carboxyl transferase subunit alpha [Natronosporangium hydrolyticum]QSB17193.1 acetyl-CoA carboxylase carboxyl transferase subunit alpha [Natronosporangium hydrolyticum]